MNRGGAETWLLNVARKIDRARFHLDFLVHTTQPAAYDEELRALGCRILPCPTFRHPPRYAAALKAICRQYGPYDVVHSHVHFFSGHVLRIARQAGIPLRIAHSHNDTLADDARAGLLRRMYLSMMRRWLHRHATLGLAASAKAAAALFGTHWQQDARWQVLFCGIDLKPFQAPGDRPRIRAEFGIPPDALVIGHVGRFEPQKNHARLVEIFDAVRARGRDAWLLLVGQGSLRAEVERQVSSLGLRDRVIFAGPRGDVPQLMLGGMDCVVFPSRFEGLPLVLVEAQAAGLPCIIADTIAPETAVVPRLVRQLSLDDSTATWADTILRLAQPVTAGQQAECRAAVARSPLSIESSVAGLERVYASVRTTTHAR